MWLLWSRTIKRIHCTQSQSTLLRSSKRLGQWTKNHTQSTQQHKYLYSPSTKETYVRQTSSYEQWFASSIKRRRIYIFPDILDHNATLPLDSFPIESIKRTNIHSTYNLVTKFQRIPHPFRLIEMNIYHPN